RRARAGCRLVRREPRDRFGDHRPHRGLTRRAPAGVALARVGAVLDRRTDEDAVTPAVGCAPWMWSFPGDLERRAGWARCRIPIRWRPRGSSSASFPTFR